MAPASVFALKIHTMEEILQRKWQNLQPRHFAPHNCLRRRRP